MSLRKKQMTKQRAQEVIKQAGGSWGVFCDWMSSQTVGMDENGEIEYYEYDVYRFVKYKCDPENEPATDYD